MRQRVVCSVISEDEMERAYKACDRFPDALVRCRNKAMLRFAETTALRRTELRTIKAEDFNWKAGYFTVIGKGDKYAELPFPKDAPLILKWAKYRPDSEWFFCTENGDQLTNRAMQAIIETIRKHAKLSNRFRWHNIRRTTATNLVDNGVPLPVVRDLLRHASLSTTDRYLSSHNWQQIGKYLSGNRDDQALRELLVKTTLENERLKKQLEELSQVYYR